MSALRASGQHRVKDGRFPTSNPIIALKRSVESVQSRLAWAADKGLVDCPDQAPELRRVLRRPEKVKRGAQTRRVRYPRAVDVNALVPAAGDPEVGRVKRRRVVEPMILLVPLPRPAFDDLDRQARLGRLPLHPAASTSS